MFSVGGPVINEKAALRKERLFYNVFLVQLSVDSIHVD